MVLPARKNPFSSERIAALAYRYTSLSKQELLLALAKLKFRAAIVGPEGSGKSKLLRELIAELEKQGKRPLLIQLRRDEPNPSLRHLKQLFSECSPADLICIDGAEQLDFLSWLLCKHSSKKTAGLLITSHVKGKLPTLLEAKTSSRLLKDILQELLPVGSALSDSDSERLFNKHGGNIREALRECYDIFAFSDNMLRSGHANAAAAAN